jgi:hypothetical protein
MTQTRAVDELRKMGFDDEHALILATECTKDKKDQAAKDKGKKLGVPDLCRAWKNGLISPTIFFRGMQDLGYSVEDARILGNLCAADLNKAQRDELAKAVAAFQKSAKDAAAAKKAQRKEAIAANKELAAAEKERIAALEKRRKEVEKIAKDYKKTHPGADQAGAGELPADAEQ